MIFKKRVQKELAVTWVFARYSHWSALVLCLLVAYSGCMLYLLLAGDPVPYFFFGWNVGMTLLKWFAYLSKRNLHWAKWEILFLPFAIWDLVSPSLGKRSSLFCLAVLDAGSHVWSFFTKCGWQWSRYVARRRRQEAPDNVFLSHSERIETGTAEIARMSLCACCYRWSFVEFVPRRWRYRNMRLHVFVRHHMLRREEMPPVLLPPLLAIVNEYDRNGEELPERTCMRMELPHVTRPTQQSIRKWGWCTIGPYTRPRPLEIHFTDDVFVVQGLVLGGRQFGFASVFRSQSLSLYLLSGKCGDSADVPWTVHEARDIPFAIKIRFERTSSRVFHALVVCHCLKQKAEEEEEVEEEKEEDAHPNDVRTTTPSIQSSHIVHISWYFREPERWTEPVQTTLVAVPATA
jgi:hypothetical protein